MNRKKLWITFSLINLMIVAFLGFLLRSKILFPLDFINYGHLINTHSHFAFGGWVTLAFFTLFTYTLLPPPVQNRNWYQWMLWGVELTSMGMLFSFSFQGYGVISIIFSTLFVFCTYGFGFCFIKDMWATNRKQPAFILSICAVISVMLSSVGPFTLAYILASGIKNSILYRDSVYFYLHFMYNGFFTLSVFALLFGTIYKNKEDLAPVNAKRFAYFLCASVIPSFFLSLLWHPDNTLFKAFAIVGIILIFGSLVYPFSLSKYLPLSKGKQDALPRALLLLVLLSFFIKSVLQMGTIFPGLGNAVFGLRPIIIGFLHLVFLGLATFYILYTYIGYGAFNIQNRLTKYSITIFVIAVILQEVVLMLQGLGLLFGSANPVYNNILWAISVLLFAGAVLIAISGLKDIKRFSNK
jgi:hypothetical protein